MISPETRALAAEVDRTLTGAAFVDTDGAAIVQPSPLDVLIGIGDGTVRPADDAARVALAAVAALWQRYPVPAAELTALVDAMSWPLYGVF